jgi:NitT/TauT family transport system permease protein/sulfonate transport system permease protein
MAHAFHGFKVYKKRVHIFIAFGVIILPIVFIFLAGRISELSVHALLVGLGLSLYRLGFAYAISLVLGVSLAVLFGLGKLGDFFVPVFDVLQNLPSFALIPVFVILFGYTNMMAIIFTASSILWPVLFNVVSALRTAKTDFNEAATIFGATGAKRIFNYYIPLSFPAILTGSIVGIAIGWEAVIGIEIIGLSSGIGTFLSAASKTGGRSILLLGIIALLLVVFSINRLVWTPLIKKSRLYGE